MPAVCKCSPKNNWVGTILIIKVDDYICPTSFTEYATVENNIFWKIINIIFIKLLAPLIVQNLKKILPLGPEL